MSEAHRTCTVNVTCQQLTGRPPPLTCIQEVARPHHGVEAPSLSKQSAMVRRFRKGKDYALASAYQGEGPRLEYTIGMTPSDEWEEEQSEDYASIKLETSGHSKPENGGLKIRHSERVEVGGEEVYMAGDDDDDDAASGEVELSVDAFEDDDDVNRSLANIAEEEEDENELGENDDVKEDDSQDEYEDEGSDAD